MRRKDGGAGWREFIKKKTIQNNCLPKLQLPLLSEVNNRLTPYDPCWLYWPLGRTSLPWLGPEFCSLSELQDKLCRPSLSSSLLTLLCSSVTEGRTGLMQLETMQVSRLIQISREDQARGSVCHTVNGKHKAFCYAGLHVCNKCRFSAHGFHNCWRYWHYNLWRGEIYKAFLSLCASGKLSWIMLQRRVGVGSLQVQ